MSRWTSAVKPQPVANGDRSSSSDGSVSSSTWRQDCHRPNAQRSCCATATTSPPDHRRTRIVRGRCAPQPPGPPDERNV
jgi:hypothetical protein